MKQIKCSQTSLSERLSGYIASASALLAIGSQASGQVVYSGLQNLELELPSDTMEIDLNSDLINDFTFLINRYSSQSGSGTYLSRSDVRYGVIINPRTSSYQNSWITKLNVPPIFSYTGTEIPILKGLTPNAEVDESQSSWVNVTSVYWAGVLGASFSLYERNGDHIYTLSGEGGDFIDKERFIGVRFFIGTEQHYGWIRAKMSADFSTLTVIDWAYESTAEIGIKTGEGSGIDFSPIFEIDGARNTSNPLTNLRITISEEITGLELSDFIVTNGIASNLTEVITGQEYTLDVTALASGMVSCSIIADAVLDEAEQGNDFISIDWIYDNIAPIGEFTLDREYTNSEINSVVLELNERVENLEVSDFTVQNGNIRSIESVGFSRFELSIEAVSEGIVILTLPAGATRDEVGNENTEISASWTYDVTPPTVNLDIEDGIIVNDSDINIPVLFNEDIEDLELTDFNVTNGIISNLTEINPSDSYLISINALEEGEVSVELPSDAVNDLSGNGNDQALVSYTYEQNPALSLNPMSNNGIRVYPNPADQILQIETDVEARISVINMKGEIVYEMESVLSETIDVSRFSTGIFLVKAIVNNQVFVQKIVLQ